MLLALGRSNAYETKIKGSPIQLSFAYMCGLLLSVDSKTGFGGNNMREFSTVRGSCLDNFVFVSVLY